MLKTNKNNKKNKKQVSIKNVFILLAITLLGMAFIVPKIQPESKSSRVSVDECIEMSRAFKGRGVPSVVPIKVANGRANALKLGELLGNVTPPCSDYAVSTPGGQTVNQIYLWDYAAEDGDYVQVFQNGVALTQPFMIKNTPVAVAVSNSGYIQVQGVKDGRGGISYAVAFEHGETFINLIKPSQHNTYTFK